MDSNRTLVTPRDPLARLPPPRPPTPWGPLLAALCAGGIAAFAALVASGRFGPKRLPVSLEPPIVVDAPSASASASPSAPPPDIAEEAAAQDALRKLARPTVDLLAWSNDPELREDDCALVVPPPRAGDVVRLRPGVGCTVVAVNGQRVDPTAAREPFAFPPFRAGLNWVRVQTTLGRQVLGFAEVPPDRRCGELQSDALPEEEAAYAQLRFALYPPLSYPGADRPGAMKLLASLPVGQDGMIRRFGRAWIELACGLHDLGHGTEMSMISAMQGETIWSRPETRRLSRDYLDEIQALLTAHPRRDRLWLGLAWQLRWGDAWDGARTAFAQALALDPRAGWSWFELARWEREMVALDHRKDPRTKEMLEDQSLQHFRIAVRRVTGKDAPGLQSVLASAAAHIKDLENRHAKHRHW